MTSARDITREPWCLTRMEVSTDHCHKLEIRTRVLKVLFCEFIQFVVLVILGKEKTSSNLKPGDGKIIIQDHIIRFALQYQFDEMYSLTQHCV